jgi:hypothetical protein
MEKNGEIMKAIVYKTSEEKAYGARLTEYFINQEQGDS